MYPRRLGRRALLASALLLLPACVVDMIETVDGAALARVGAYHDMDELSREPYASELAPARITVWFDGESEDEYLRIHPDVDGSGAHVAPGSMIVREVRDAAGTITKLTVMCKGPPGYNADLGDWWFAVTDPDGLPLPDAAGTPIVGKVGDCYSCHAERAADDFLFGMPAAETR